MACGFWKPHLPFNAPKKYWDLYDREKIPVANNRFRPAGLPDEVKTLEKSMLTHVLPQQMISIFRKKPNTDIMPV